MSVSYTNVKADQLTQVVTQVLAHYRSAVYHWGASVQAFNTSYTILTYEIERTCSCNYDNSGSLSIRANLANPVIFKRKIYTELNV